MLDDVDDCPELVDEWVNDSLQREASYQQLKALAAVIEDTTGSVCYILSVFTSAPPHLTMTCREALTSNGTSKVWTSNGARKLFVSNNATNISSSVTTGLALEQY